MASDIGGDFTNNGSITGSNSVDIIANGNIANHALNPPIRRNHHHWHWFLPNPPLLENNAEAMGVEIGAGEHETMTMVVLL